MELFHASSPRSGTSQDSFHGCLAPFIEHLKQEGLTEGRIRCLRASLGGRPNPAINGRLKTGHFR